MKGQIRLWIAVAAALIILPITTVKAQITEPEPSRFSDAIVFPVVIRPTRNEGSVQPGYLFDFRLSRASARSVTRELPPAGFGEEGIKPTDLLWIAVTTRSGQTAFCSDQDYSIRCLRDADEDGRFEQYWSAMRGGCTILREAACREPTPLAYQGRQPLADGPVSYSTPAPSELSDPRAMAGQAQVVWNRRSGAYEVTMWTGEGRRKRQLPGSFTPIRPQVPGGPALLNQHGLRVQIEGVDSNGAVKIASAELPVEFGALFTPLQ
ncbi:MAG: hypothetical protein AB1448_01060 [Pseudomonadota bacterium]